MLWLVLTSVNLNSWLKSYKYEQPCINVVSTNVFPCATLFSPDFPGVDCRWVCQAFTHCIYEARWCNKNATQRGLPLSYSINCRVSDKNINLVVACVSPKPNLYFITATFTHLTCHPQALKHTSITHSGFYTFGWWKPQSNISFFLKKQAEIWTHLTTDFVSTGFLSVWDKLVPKGNSGEISLQGWCMASSLHNTFSGCISGGGSKLCWVIKRSSCCTSCNRTHE